MYAFKIKGGKTLDGTVAVKGAKNAILPLMVAALLTDKPVTLKNVSFLADVATLSRLLESLGVKITTTEDSITLEASAITNTTAAYEFVSKMRASFWVLGPLLGRCGHAAVSLPGGCAIGPRPSDWYMKVLTTMGAKIEIENGYVVAQGPLHAAEIFFLFPIKSVGVTHTVLMAAVLTPGTTVIHNPAMEPEVMDLIALLQKMGAKIDGAGTSKLVIQGVASLHGATHTVVSDRIETATFAVAAAVTRGNVFIEGGRLDLMEAVADMMSLSGVAFKQEPNGLRVDARAAALQAVPVTTAEYPGFPTDAQPLATTFLSIAAGEALVSERIFENRLMHIPELQRMGADITILDGQSVLIKGCPALHGATLTASDLRGGVGLVLAGLAAEGETVVQRVYHIDRGYYRLEEKLAALGADIERVHLS